jgi:hypothetical protein
MAVGCARVRERRLSKNTIEMAAKPLVVSPAQQSEAVGNLLAVRQLGIDLVDVFAKSHGREARDAVKGAEKMVATIDRVLEILDAPAELYREAQR